MYCKLSDAIRKKVYIFKTVKLMVMTMIPYVSPTLQYYCDLNKIRDTNFFGSESHTI